MNRFKIGMAVFAISAAGSEALAHSSAFPHVHTDLSPAQLLTRLACVAVPVAIAYAVALWGVKPSDAGVKVAQAS